MMSTTDKDWEEAETVVNAFEAPSTHEKAYRAVADEIARIRAESAKEAALKERERWAAEIAGYRLVIKYAIEKDAKDGYTMHPDIVERLSAILTPDSASERED